MTFRELRAAHEATLSHGEVHSVLRDALRGRHADAYVWLEDVYDDRVVYTVEPKNGTEEPGGLRYYQTAYAIDDADAVTLGDSIEVERVVTYVPVAAPVIEGATELYGDLVPLSEAKGARRQVKVIGPGWGSSGYWPAEILERDGPAAWPAGTHMYLDHPTTTEESERPERSLRDLAATLATPATFNVNGPAGPGLYAETVVVDGFSDLIDQLAEDIGVSVNTWAEAPVGEAEGRRGPVVARIATAVESPFNSVDFITKAGAGGKVLALMESLRPQVPSPTPPPAPHAGVTTRTAEAAAPQGEESIVDEIAQLKEQLTAANTRTTELEAENTGLKTENATLREHAVLAEARSFVAGKLAEAELPEITKARMSEALVAGAVQAEDGSLDTAALEVKVTAAVAAEAEYIAKLAESGKVRDQGAGGPGADKAAVRESFKRRYLAEGMGEDQAEKMAAHAAAGR